MRCSLSVSNVCHTLNYPIAPIVLSTIPYHPPHLLHPSSDRSKLLPLLFFPVISGSPILPSSIFYALLVACILHLTLRLHYFRPCRARVPAPASAGCKPTMSWQPKLRPKGFPHTLDDFAVASLSELEHRSRTGEDKRDQRVFRVKRKHVLKACDRCRVKKTKVSLVRSLAMAYAYLYWQCDGKQPCNRCSVYNHPCLFRERKATQTKVYSRG